MTMPTGDLDTMVVDAQTGHLEETTTKVIEGRSLYQLAWRRIRRSKIAMISFGFIVLLLLMAIFAPVLTAIEGHGPLTVDNNAVSQGSQSLEGPTAGDPLPGFRLPSAEHWLGVEPVNGRDTFARLVYGARVSLTISLLATLVSVVLGVLFGAMAGYFRGITDTVISRIMDLLLAFPLLLLILTLSPILQDRLGSTFLGQGSTLPIAALVIILGFFGWPYLGRIVRGQVLSLREREFVQAAQAMGAKPGRIILREILPNLTAVILVYATLAIPTNITAEAALSFLGAGVHDPTPSWGQMLNAAQNESWYQTDPFFMLVPGLALLFTVLAFNLFGDAVRDALDPRASRD